MALGGDRVDGSAEESQVDHTTVFYVVFVPVFGLLSLAFAIISFLMVVSLTIREPDEVDAGSMPG